MNVADQKVLPTFHAISTRNAMWRASVEKDAASHLTHLTHITPCWQASYLLTERAHVLSTSVFKLPSALDTSLAWDPSSTEKNGCALLHLNISYYYYMNYDRMICIYTYIQYDYPHTRNTNDQGLIRPGLLLGKLRGMKKIY